MFSISILYALLQEYFPSKECFPKFKLKKSRIQPFCRNMYKKTTPSVPKNKSLYHSNFVPKNKSSYPI